MDDITDRLRWQSRYTYGIVSTTIEAAAKEIESLRQQLTDAEESNKAVERALKDVDYRGSYADGVKYLKRQLASVAKERDEIKAQARMLDRMVDERDEQLAAALAAIESTTKALTNISGLSKDFVAREIADTALTIKPDASILKAHDEALIERCAEVCDSLFERRGIDCAAAIRELKGTL